MKEQELTTIREILGRGTIHPFPARMAPSVALEALGKNSESLRVLDPMSGSGTVLAVAQSRGHRAVGVDCDPLSVLNAKVWTTPIVEELVVEKAIAVSDRARELIERTSSRDAYPSGCDDETRKFIRFWFDPQARRELWSLSVAIGRIRDKSTRDVLWSAFSRMIIAKQAGVSLAMDLSHSRPHKVYSKAPVSPLSQFVSATEQVAANCTTKRKKGIGPPSQVRLGDCRCLPFRRASFDLVVTSPPYLNAIDYLRCSKFSLVWMGYRIAELRTIRSTSVGSEASGGNRALPRAMQRSLHQMGSINKLQGRYQRILARYVRDMHESTQEVARVLRPGGTAVYVVGNNYIRSVPLNNSEALKAIAASVGLTLEEEYSRELPPNRRYLPPPSITESGRSLQARMRTEVVLRFASASVG